MSSYSWPTIYHDGTLMKKNCSGKWNVGTNNVSSLLMLPTLDKRLRHNVTK